MGRGALVGLTLLLSTAAPATSAPATATPAASEQSVFSKLLVDATAEVGLDFRHRNGMSGQRFVVEVLGGGGALFDYDGDGDLDLYAVQGHALATASSESAPSQKDPSGKYSTEKDRLYRNELIPGGQLRFQDVTGSSRIDAQGYGMGAAVGDFDQDGHTDLYVLNWGANQLWRNRGDGTFEDRTASAGVGDSSWSTAATFFDYDADGDLDLFVGNYLDFRLEQHKPCFAPSGVADYCGPASFRPAADRLYRNRGDGRFEDVTASAGLATASASALGVVSFDLDGDRRLDLFVANDGMANHLWRQGEGGRFEEMALLAGCAVNSDGVAEASMGVDAGDVDGDGDEDLFMAHLDQETHTLYLNDGDGFFDDGSDASGIALPSFPFTGFGSRLADLDNDGILDLIVVNGAIKSLEPLVRQGDAYPLHQTDQIWRGLGAGRFENMTAVVGAAFEHSAVSRGLSAGDLDNDGDLDLVIFDNNGPARILRNELAGPRHWIGLELWDAQRRRIATGSRVGVFVAGGEVIWRRIRTDGSYASAQDGRLLIGLGGATKIDKIRIEWHGGGVEKKAVEEIKGLALDRYHRIERGGLRVEP